MILMKKDLELRMDLRADS